MNETPKTGGENGDHYHVLPKKPSEIIRERAFVKWQHQPMYAQHIGNFETAQHHAIQPKSLSDFLIEETLVFLDELDNKII